jgi:hypothetical protein
MKLMRALAFRVRLPKGCNISWSSHGRIYALPWRDYSPGVWRRLTPIGIVESIHLKFNGTPRQPGEIEEFGIQQM